MIEGILRIASRELGLMFQAGTRYVRSGRRVYVFGEAKQQLGVIYELPERLELVRLSAHDLEKISAIAGIKKVASA